MTIISGSVGRYAQFGYGVVWRLDPPVEGLKYAVVNAETDGSHKVYTWKTGDSFSVDVRYTKGPEALMIRKIL